MLCNISGNVMYTYYFYLKNTRILKIKLFKLVSTVIKQT